MKGIILHGGHGTRLGPLTQSIPKQLLPIANKPMSQYALEDLRNANIFDIAIVIGDVYPEKVKNFYNDGSNFGVHISYIYQDHPKGIAHAISLCKDFVGNDDFVVYLGDNIMRKNLCSFEKQFSNSDSDSMILVSEVTEPSRFGIAEFDNKKLTKIIEKPKNTISNLAVIGIYFFKSNVFPIIEKLKPSWRNELEVTDTLQLMLEGGFKIDVGTVTGWWKDTGTPKDIIDANNLILNTLGDSDQLLNDKKISTSKIVIDSETIVDQDSIIEEPVIIGKNCKIINSKIGPNVSIGDNSIIQNSILKNSVIMNNCHIEGNISFDDSIIGSNSIIKISSSVKFTELLLGDSSKIKI
jgi:glucose-1-phosphate thymidylyltransferase